MEMGVLTRAEWRRWRGDWGWGLMVGWDGWGAGGGIGDRLVRGEWRDGDW